MPGEKQRKKTDRTGVSRSARMRRDARMGDREMTQQGTGDRAARPAKGHAREDPTGGLTPPPGPEHGSRLFIAIRAIVS